MQEAAQLIEKHMTSKGVKFCRPCVPTSIVRHESGKLQVNYKDVESMEDKSELFDTVLSAIGRNADLEVCEACLFVQLTVVYLSFGPQSDKIVLSL